MILGQAMESSAGDPTQAGKIRSEFFYDPFFAGDNAEHVNSFYKILRGLNHMKYYLINTGGVGEGARYKEITVDHTMAILDSLFREGLEDWVASPTGFSVPKSIRMIDDIYLHPERLYSKDNFKRRQREVNNVRRQAIREVGGTLHPNIMRVFRNDNEQRLSKKEE
jgi:phosphoenolpyruvate carboxykinase (ATP)